MDDQNHTELLRLQATQLTGSTPFCPEDQLIAEYFDGDLAEAERIKLERHLTDCRCCLARIGILERLEESRSNKRVTEAVLATAKQMSPMVPVRRFGPAPAWASAAAVVIAIFIIASKDQEAVLEPGVSPSAVPSTEEINRQLRSVKRGATDLNVLSPKPGAAIVPGTLIQWAEVPGKLHYDIFVLSHTGDVLWTERTDRTEWVLPEPVRLPTDSKYYFRVEALLPDGRSVSSRHVVFRIAERQ
jgi:hypothetical protein